MKKIFNGLTTINVELTNRCNKKCWMCGRRKIERDYPELVSQYGDMDFNLVKKISKELPSQIVVQLHNNGEALLYTRFGETVKLFNRQITNIVTNGKLLVEKSKEIIDNLDSLSISVIEKDNEADEQYEIIEKFLKLKGNKKPYTTLRLNGDVNEEKYQKFNVLIVKRILHHPMGSFKYKKKQPTIPEIGMCWDFLNHPAINIKGDMSICVRFDPERLGVLGNIKGKSIAEIWNGEKRMKWLKHHISGQRYLVPLCKKCEFWGVPTGP